MPRLVSWPASTSCRVYQVAPQYADHPQSRAMSRAAWKQEEIVRIKGASLREGSFLEGWMSSTDFLMLVARI
jgi:hypothetical protein